jgi:hypothetical protein
VCVCVCVDTSTQKFNGCGSNSDEQRQAWKGLKKTCIAWDVKVIAEEGLQ